MEKNTHFLDMHFVGWHLDEVLQARVVCRLDLCHLNNTERIYIYISCFLFLAPPNSKEHSKKNGSISLDFISNYSLPDWGLQKMC